jgi:hypothetical protein
MQSFTTGSREFADGLGPSSMKIPKQFVRRIVNSLGYDVRRIEMPVPAAEHRVITRELLLPKISVSDVIDGTTTIRILEPQEVNGNVSLLEMLILNTLVAKLKPQVLFEIGTFDGRTTLNFAANAGSNARTFTLDLPPDEPCETRYALDPADVQFVSEDRNGPRFKGTPLGTQIVQLFGDSGKFDFSPYSETADFVFVDGSHSYDYVKNDSRTALQLIKRPGVIVWHDYQPWWPDVVECLEELHASESEFSGMKHIAETALVLLEIS